MMRDLDTCPEPDQVSITVAVQGKSICIKLADQYGQGNSIPYGIGINVF